MRNALTLATALAGAALLLPMTAAAQDADAIARGARVYSANCGRCHNPRPATERTDAEWVTIVAQMRARATLSRSDARAVLAFLQATNLPEGPQPVQRAAASAVPATGGAVTPAPPPPPAPESPAVATEASTRDGPRTFELGRLGLPPGVAEPPVLTVDERRALLEYLRRLSRKEIPER